MDPTEFGKLFRLFLGLPTHRHPEDRGVHQDDHGGEGDYDEDHRQASNPRDEVIAGENRGRKSFSVFTEPLEMHRFFEQQMDDLLRSFGDGFGGLGRGGAIMMEPREEEDSHGGCARDFMLKDEGQPKIDRDLDSSEVDMGELELLMRRKGSGRGEEADTEKSKRNLFEGSLRLGEGSLFGGIHGGPGGIGIFGGLGRDEGENNNYMRSYSYGSSVVEQSTRLPSGGVETMRTVRNSDGTEVVTVTRKIGDQVHQQTTNTDREGKSTTENRFTNIEEGQLTQFDNKMDGGGWQVQPSPREEMMGPPSDKLYGTLWNKFWGK